LVLAVIVLLAAAVAPVVVGGGDEVAPVLTGPLTKWTTRSTILDKTENQN
jgi:hypothetical protein